jgi:hypothetical protein
MNLYNFHLLDQKLRSYRFIFSCHEEVNLLFPLVYKLSFRLPFQETTQHRILVQAIYACTQISLSSPF